MPPCFGILSTLQGSYYGWMRILLSQEGLGRQVFLTSNSGVSISPTHPGPPGNFDIPALRLKADTGARAEGKRQGSNHKCLIKGSQLRLYIRIIQETS